MAGGTAVVGHDASSPLHDGNPVGIRRLGYENRSIAELFDVGGGADHTGLAGGDGSTDGGAGRDCGAFRFQAVMPEGGGAGLRSEEHTSELQSLMRISYAVFCLKKKNKKTHNKCEDIHASLTGPYN